MFTIFTQEVLLDGVKEEVPQASAGPQAMVAGPQEIVLAVAIVAALAAAAIVAAAMADLNLKVILNIKPSSKKTVKLIFFSY